MDVNAEEEFEKLLRDAPSWDLAYGDYGDHPILEISKAVARLPVLPGLTEWINLYSSEFPKVINEGTEHCILRQIDLLADKTTSFCHDLGFDLCTYKVTAEFMVNILLEKIKKYQNSKESSFKPEIGDLIRICKKLVENKQITNEIISDEIIKDGRSVPLDILLQLIDAEFLFVDKYLSASLAGGGIKQQKCNPFETLQSDLNDYFQQCHGDYFNELPAEKVMGFVLLLTTIYDPTKNMGKIMQNTLTGMIIDVFKKHDWKDFWSSKNRRWVTILSGFEYKNFATKRTLIIQLLEAFLRNGDQISLNDAFLGHSEWVCEKLQDYPVEALQSFVVDLDNKEITSVVSSVMRKNDCDLKRLLTLISVWLVSCVEAPSILDEMLKTLFVDCFEIKNMQLLKLTILVARHCSLHSLFGYPLYKSWLQNALIKVPFAADRSSLSMYVNCLMELLPKETLGFLKLHLSVLPQVPVSAKQLLNEYSRIGRTRLSDLKENLKQNFQQQCYFGEKLDEGAIMKVEAFLDQYRACGHVPKTVYEMSVFRKAYYVGSFLPALLNPEPCRRDQDRQKFVEELKKSGKIPGKIYRAFEQACKDADLVDIVNDSSRGLTEVTDAVIRKMSDFPNIVKESVQIESSKRRKAAVQLFLFSASSHLAKLKQTCDKMKTDERAHLMINYKLADALLDNICHAYALACHDRTSSAVSFSWVKATIQMVISHAYLLTRFQSRILELLATEIDSLESYHLQAISCIVSAIGNVSMQTDRVDKFFLKKAVVSSLGTVKEARSKGRIHQSFAFISYLMLFCSESASDVLIVEDDLLSSTSVISEAVLLPKSVFDLWMIMTFRRNEIVSLIQQFDDAESKRTLKKIKESLEFAEVVQKCSSYKVACTNHQFDLQKWLDFEVETDDANDYLPIFLKETYFYNIVQQNQNRNLTNDEWSWSNVAKTLILAMLKSSEERRNFAFLFCNQNNHGERLPSEITTSFPRSKDPDSPQCKIGREERVQPSSNRVTHSLLCFLRTLSSQVELENSATHITSERISWFLASIESWLDSLPSSHLKAQISVVQIYRLGIIIDTLPPHVLFSCSIRNNSQLECLPGLASVLNRIASLSVNAVYYLPRDLFVRICTALTTQCNRLRILSPETSEAYFQSSIEHFLSKCPVYCISLVKYYSCSTVKRQIAICKDLTDHIFDEVSCLHEALDSANFKLASNFASFSSEIRAVSIYLKWQSLTAEEKQFYFNSFSELENEILQGIIECLLIKFIACLLQGELKLDSDNDWLIALRIIKKAPTHFARLVEDLMSENNYLGLRQLRMIAVSQPYRQLIPFVAVKIFAKMDPLYLRHLFEIPKCREIVSRCIRASNSLINEYAAEEPRNVLLSPYEVTFMKELKYLEKHLQ